MSNNLESLLDNDLAVAYATNEGQILRNSESLEENASFLARWAAELFGEWAAWMRHVLPGSVRVT